MQRELVVHACSGPLLLLLHCYYFNYYYEYDIPVPPRRGPGGKLIRQQEEHPSLVLLRLLHANTHSPISLVMRDHCLL